MTTTARAALQNEDERVRVTRWDFEPQESTGRHVHEHDYVVVPVTDGQTDVITPDGTVTTSQLRAGQSYARPAGGEHEVVNTGCPADLHRDRTEVTAPEVNKIH